MSSNESSYNTYPRHTSYKRSSGRNLLPITTASSSRSQAGSSGSGSSSSSNYKITSAIRKFHHSDIIPECVNNPNSAAESITTASASCAVAVLAMVWQRSSNDTVKIISLLNYKLFKCFLIFILFVA